MPRKAATPEELALKKQVEDLIKSIKGDDKPGPDIDKAIKLFEKAQSSITQAIAVLKGEALEEEVDPNRKRAGRPKKVKEADLFDSIPPGEVAEVKPEASTKRKKGAATEPVNAPE
jgi:hypothetical protein